MMAVVLISGVCWRFQFLVRSCRFVCVCLFCS